jgi:hypothetical protein
MRCEIKNKAVCSDNVHTSDLSNQSSEHPPQSLALSRQNLNLRIADIAIAIASVDPTLKLQIEGAAEKFIDSERKPDITIEAKWGDLSKVIRGGKKIFDSGSLWQLYHSDRSYLFSFTSPILGSTPYKVARTNKNFTKGEVLLHRPYFDKDQSIYPLEYPLDELLFINFLSSGRGVEVHACGVVESMGRGHLFLGQSGAGKTTIAKLWQKEPGVTVLSDDRIILRQDDGKFWIYGTPWHGDAGLASPSRAPLTAVYFLEKGQKNELVAQKATDSISRLFTCSFPPFYNRDALDFSLGFLEGVVRDAPCYELKFIPDKSVVEFIQEERFT